MKKQTPNKVSVNVTQMQNLALPSVMRRDIDFGTGVIKDGGYWLKKGNSQEWVTTNDFPNYLIRLLGESPTAKACLRTVISFLEGRGLSWEKANTLIVNDNKETLLQVFQKVARSRATFRRFALLVKYRGLKISSLECLAPEAIRYEKPNQNGETHGVIYNPYFDTTEERNHKPIFYPLFDVSSAVKDLDLFLSKNSLRNENGSDVHKFGQVLFWNDTDEQNRVYSRPEYFSAENAIKLEAQICRFHHRNVANNFFLGGIMSITGDPDQPILDKETGEPTGRTLGEETRLKLANLFAGENNAGAVADFWNTDPEAPPVKFEAFQSSSNDSTFLELHQVIKEIIVTAFGVPSILANIETAGKLGSSQERELANQIMTENVKSMQVELAKIFEALINASVWADNKMVQLSVIPRQTYIELPEWVIAQMPFEAKADYIKKQYGIDILPVQNPT